jgi:16S rRNA C967 or C1407 C5-methylase (RsmB/RsmF family)/NOL1/NOP2/fmu family ribosome biogenesis protein
LTDSFSQRFFIVKKLPESLLISLEGIEGFDKKSFIKVHEEGEQVTSIRINPNKLTTGNKKWEIEECFDQLYSKKDLNLNDSSITNCRLQIASSVPWSQYGFYLKERPSFTFDPLFHAGCYYVQEASSMFLEQAFKQLFDLSKPLRVLDLCAAPGGKSTHIQSFISSDSLLVSNEIIKSRCLALIDNMIKWGCRNAFVTNNDPSAFQNLEGYFDVMIADAPCSGSGLFRKDEEAIDEWSLHNVQLCSERQQRILAGALPALKENGILIYSTCSYSKEEDEDIADWLVEEFEMENVKLKLEEHWNIIESFSSKTNSETYRFYPDQLKGEGLFMACFQKTGDTKKPKYRAPKPNKASSIEKDIIRPWLKNEDYELIKDDQSFFALPAELLSEYTILNSVLNIPYKGTGLGQIMKNRLVPEHSLALSTAVSDKIPYTELGYEDAIKYLQKQDLHFNSSEKGWQLVRYSGHNLGWVNVLPNRINNYYPKEIRILKLRNDSAFEK